MTPIVVHTTTSATGGTAGTGVTGTVAGSWTVNVGGTATAVASVVADAHGHGNTQKVVCTFAALNDFCRVQIPISSSLLPVGTILEAAGVIDVAAGSSNCMMPELYVPYIYNSVTYQLRDINLALSPASPSQPTTASTYTFRTPKGTVGVTPGGATYEILVYVYASGSCTFQLSSPSVTIRYQ